MNDKKPTLAYIKRQAKNLKKEKGITHTEALELISKGFGFFNWIHCQRSLSEQSVVETQPNQEKIQLSFSDWIAKHKNRNSALGDLANKRGFVDRESGWPLYDNIEAYQNYLTLNSPPSGAMPALERAWKTYNSFLKRKNSPDARNRIARKPIVKKHDPRTIVFVKNVTPLHYNKRTIEKFNAGDKVWVSWNRRKAIPVTITKADEITYSFKVERPLNRAWEYHTVDLYEVGSTPELACINYIG